MNNFTEKPDGSLVYDQPIECASAYFYPDPNNPNRYIPKVDPCVHRTIELRVLRCGRSRSTWSCVSLGTNVSPAVCNKCLLTKT